jgi:signal transduction histidine kinase/ligand-binding sensor domain-containing protein/DNA-binding response OmpR family regulator
MRRLFLSIFFAFAICGISLSQALQYKFMRLDVNDGLSANQVTCFLRDSRGFMWIGTSSGLNRFDGYSLRIYRNDNRDTASISNSFVSAMAEDPEGRLWITSAYNSGAIDVYDPKTDQFSPSSQEILKRYGIPPGTVSHIVKDSKGNFWFVHSTGLYKYNPVENKSHEVKYIEGDGALLPAQGITSLVEDTRANLWAIQRNGMLVAITVSDDRVVYRNPYFVTRFKGLQYDYRLMVDSDGDVWAHIANANQGVFYFDTKAKSFTPITSQSSRARLNTDIVRGMAEDNNGMIWVGTDHGGVNLIDKKTWTVRYLFNNPEDDQSLSQNSLTSVYKDRSGIIWLSTFKQGLCYYHENIVRFPLYRHNTIDANSLNFDDINRFVEDSKGNIWIGSNGGGLIYFDREKGTFKQYRHDPSNPNSVSSNVIVSLCLDHSGVLWIGTYYGGLNSFDGRKFTRYKHDPSKSSSLSDDNVWEIFEDSQHNLWIGTLYAGLELFDRKTNTFQHYRGGDVNSVHTNYISVLKEDKKGNLWVGTGWGIDVMEKSSGTFTHIINQDGNPDKLSNNSILEIMEDSRGLVWVGTQEGLNLYDPEKKTFRSFREEDGLPHNTVFTILEDDAGNLWMSTPNGLSNLIIKKEVNGLSFSFKNYDEADGLQGKQFNENAALKTSKGELIFAGAYGFNIFRPEKIIVNTVKPDIVLTDLQVFNKSIGIGEKVNGHVILDKSISESGEIILKHSDNVFSLEFAALNYFHPEKCLYRYKLENFNKEWVTTDGRSRKVTYTNLDPGKYVFRVIASNNDGIWNDKGISLRIEVLPPFWKTKLALAIYIFFILGGLFITRKLIQQRERMKFAIEQERQEAHRMHELDMMKIRFFTNVSHEFRTPLTLILTPVEKLLKQAKEADQQNQFQLIHRNARRLLNLVNQLLDFRKMEVQEIKLNPSEGDIIKFIKDTVFSFSDLSEKKDISLDFNTSLSTFETLFDADKLEKILFNLLSNAFKFTPAHGAVAVSVDLVDRQQDKWLEIKVKDTGIGVPADKQDKIFERFFQHDVPTSMVNQGSGIGLSITKEFVRIHGGTISVESEVEKGSTFTVLLPVKDVVHPDVHVTEESVQVQEPQLMETTNGEEISVANKLPTLLLVEDNEDFRFYLKDNLKDQYNILEAKNGKEGWSKVISSLPDLIVSDVMMPLMNGMELARKVKHDPRVSHIPIILLTARTAEEQKMEGFETGADDYITKPFNFEILQSRIRNLIHQRELFHKDFRKQFEIRASDVNITSLDEKLIQNAIKHVELNISSPDFSVEDLSHELGMSRVHLYKKLLALTGKSPLEFIRAIRLQQAAQLLEKSQLTVSEVAYKVGFNNPKYFTRYFKEEYKMLPSAYASEKRRRNGEGS